ncbi:MAG: enolase C-terminal domain-like protein [Opitutales bacterium]
MNLSSLSRRQFVSTALATPLLAELAWAKDLTRDIRINRVIHCRIPTRRSKVAGKNSRKEVHGDSSGDALLRLFTNSGHEGFGHGRMQRKQAESLLGKNPFDFLDQKARKVSGPFGVGTMPAWDLAGKILGKPTHAMLGGKGPAKVPVYDGSIYFADLLPDYATNWKDRFRKEIDMGIKAGHRAFKVKIGRGAKWMERKAGNQRDTEVLETIRAHGGKNLILGIDANNGYDLAGTKRLFGEIGDLDIAFAEEMFSETVEHCLEFKAFLRKNKWKTLVADGETQGNLQVFKPFIEASAIEVYQADMKRFGFEGILQEAAWAAQKDLLVAPHNWGSLVGYYMQLQVGRAIPNFYRAEHDPLSTPILIDEGYSRKDGLATVPDTPGCGLAIDEKAFAKQAKVFYDLKS